MIFAADWDGTPDILGPKVGMIHAIVAGLKWFLVAGRLVRQATNQIGGRRGYSEGNNSNIKFF